MEVCALTHANVFDCGRWNRVSVNKISTERSSLKPEVEVHISMYEPLEVSECEKRET